MRAIQSVTTLLFAAALVGGCSEDVTMDEVTETVVPTSGGNALSFDGRFEARFPPDALTEEQRITIRTRRSPDADLLSPIYEVGPRSAVLARPVQVRIRSVPAAGFARIGDDGRRTRIPSFDDRDDQVAEVLALGAFALTSLPSDAGVVADAGTLPDTGLIIRDAGFPDAGTSTVVLDAGTVADGGMMPPDGGGMPRDGGVIPPDAGPGDAGVVSSDAGSGSDAGAPVPATLATCGVSPNPEVEPNDTLASAQPINIDYKAPMMATLTSTNDVDWFGIVSQNRTTSMRISTHTELGNPLGCSGLDTLVTVTDAMGNVVASNDNAHGTTCAAVDLANVARSTALYIRVEWRGLAPRPYYLTIIDGSGATLPTDPDLTVEGTFLSRAVWRPGGTYDVVVCLENAVAANLPPTTTGLFLSTNNIIRLNDVQIGALGLPALGGGAVAVQSFTGVIPGTFPAPSMAYVGAIGDLLSQAVERSKVNNIGSAVPVNIVP